MGAQEHVAKFDCDNPNGDPMFLESATDKMYSLIKGNKCYLEWAGEKNSVHGIWAQERIAKFDCGGGGDTFQIHGNRGADQFVTTKTSTETCHFQWVGSSGGAGIGNNEYIAKWDCEAGASGDPMRIISKNPVTTTYTLIKSDVECNSSDVSLGSQDTLQDCADACEADSECDYFVFGKGSKHGLCYHEKTSSAACSEGWETDKYDFYSLVGNADSTPQPQSPPTPAASPTPAGHPMCGAGTTLVDGVCTLSPKSCPELTKWHPTLNACQSTVNGVCSVETAYRPKNGVISWYYFFGDTVADPAYGELVSGTRGGHCLDQDGNHCSASVRDACDTIRSFDQQGFTNGVAGKDLCTTVSPGGGFSFVPGYSYQAFFDACGTLFNAGMRVEQRHGI